MRDGLRRSCSPGSRRASRQRPARLLRLLLAACCFLGRCAAAVEEECATGVFVISTGRTGSTSLMAMLNGLPGVSVMGENMGAWHEVWKLDKALRASRGVISKWVTYAFLHSESADRAAQLAGYRSVLRGTINAPASARLVGFKEVRWAWEEGLGDADLLLEAFPCAKVVLSYREQVEGQARSAWHANATPVHKLAMENAELDGFKRRHEGATFRLPSERFSTAAVDELFAWLGFPHCHALYLIRANENGRDTGHFEPKPASAVRCDEEKG